MEKIISIVIAKDFSEIPGARYPEEGDFSGEDFRVKFLVPKIEEAIRENAHLKIDLDGTAGYGTSFLEEAFGGLIRHNDYTYDQLHDIIIFKSEEDSEYITEIYEYMKDAQDKKNNQ